MEGQEALAMKIKAWIPIRKVQLPPLPEADFEWFHIIEDSEQFKNNRNLCCLYLNFNLDMTDKSQKSKTFFGQTPFQILLLLNFLFPVNVQQKSMMVV